MDVVDPDLLHQRAAALMGIPRALTGDGVRASLAEIAGWLPDGLLATVEVASGQTVLDWTVPQEWNLRRATLTAPDGTVVADTAAHLLHVVGYSHAVDTTISLAELEAGGHLHSVPEVPDAIPWRTSYYRRTWGFCMADRVRRSLPDGDYRAVIDASLAPGHLTYGEATLPGSSDREVLLSAHICHPAMANDNVSGNVVAAAVLAALADRPTRRFTYRLLLAPGTIGAITWLARNGQQVGPRVHAGLVLSGVADPGPSFTYKRTVDGDAPIDRATTLALRDGGYGHDVVDYEPWGYDERQFNSPGYRMGVGLLTRTPHGAYPQYHTSADDLAFISGDRLAQAVRLVLDVIDVLEADRCHRNLKPHGEPQLGPRGLYPSVGGQRGQQAQLAMLWVLALSDGTTPLSSIAQRSGLPFADLADAAVKLVGTDLLETVA